LVGSASASKTPGRSSMIRSATIRAYQQCCQAREALVPASVVLVERGDALRLGKGRETGLHHAQACAALNRLEIEFDQGQRLLLCQWSGQVVSHGSRLPAPGEVARRIDGLD